MRTRHPVSGLLAGLLAVTLTACGGGDGQEKSPVSISGVDEGEFKGAEPAAPYEMPDVTLSATTKTDFNLRADTDTKVTLVFFGYTHCRDVCPLVMSDLTAAYLQLDDQVREQTQLLFITSDPARDDIATLKAYLDRYDPSFIGVTGAKKTIVSVGAAMGVQIARGDTLPSGGFEVAHGAQVVGFSGDAAPVLWTPGTPVADLVADITKLAGS